MRTESISRWTADGAWLSGSVTPSPRNGFASAQMRGTSSLSWSTRCKPFGDSDKEEVEAAATMLERIIAGIGERAGTLTLFAGDAGLGTSVSDWFR